MTDDLEGAVRALHRKGVHFWLENGALRYRAPKGLVTGEEIAALHRLDSARLRIVAGQLDGTLFRPQLIGNVRLKLAPLSFNQLAHWEMVKYRPVRQVASATRISGPLQVTAMKEALSAVIERHGSLRTNIVSSVGVVMQQILERPKTVLVASDMTHVPVSSRDKQVNEQISSAIVDVFDYSVDPLFTSVLLKLEESENILILATDHMVSDGASVGIIEREIFAAYEQLLHGRDVSLPEVSMQYADYANWQRVALADYFNAQRLRAQAWPRTKFPTDAGLPEYRGWGQVRFTLESRIRAELEQFARRRGTTLVMVVLTVYVALVMRWCRTFDATVQVISDGRTSRAIENTVGYLAYPLYLGVAVERDATFMELLHAVTAGYCQACEDPDFYYSYTLSPRPEFTRNTCFNWRPWKKGLGDQCTKGVNDSISKSSVPFDDPALDGIDMDVEPGIGFQDMGRDIAGFVVYPKSQFARAGIERFATAFRLLLHTVLACPAVRLRELVVA